MELTDEQLNRFHTDGYLVIPNFFTADTAAALKRRADELQQQLDLSTHPRTIFRTALAGSQTTTFSTAADATNESKEESKQNSSSNNTPPTTDPNRYFLDSADKISYFFEEKAFDTTTGQLTVEKTAAINKIGHALHTLDPTFTHFSTTPALRHLTQLLGFRHPVILQSMLIFKHPRIGNKVDVHRDSTFLYTEPRSTAVGFWFALERCDRLNGTLRFVKGSHRDGGSDRRMRRSGVTNRTTINNVPASERQNGQYEAPLNEGVSLVFTGEDKTASGYSEDQWTMEEVDVGSLILIHGDVVHASGHNHSDKSRYIYTFHTIDDDTDAQYSRDNWLQSAELFTHLQWPHVQRQVIRQVERHGASSTAEMLRSPQRCKMLKVEVMTLCSECVDRRKFSAASGRCPYSCSDCSMPLTGIREGHASATTTARSTAADVRVSLATNHICFAHLIVHITTAVTASIQSSATRK